MAALCRPIQPSHGCSVPMASADRRTGTLTNLTNNPDQTLLSRTPAIMPEAPKPSDPAGLGPDSKHPGDMNNPSQINPTACAGASGAAGHDAAACVSACSECAGAGVHDARDTSGSSSTTLPVQVGQVVAPHLYLLVLYNRAIES